MPKKKKSKLKKMQLKKKKKDVLQSGNSALCRTSDHKNFRFAFIKRALGFLGGCL